MADFDRDEAPTSHLYSPRGGNRGYSYQITPPQSVTEAQLEEQGSTCQSPRILLQEPKAGSPTKKRKLEGTSPRPFHAVADASRAARMLPVQAASRTCPAQNTYGAHPTSVQASLSSLDSPHRSNTEASPIVATQTSEPSDRSPLSVTKASKVTLVAASVPGRRIDGGRARIAKSVATNFGDQNVNKVYKLSLTVRSDNVWHQLEDQEFPLLVSSDELDEYVDFARQQTSISPQDDDGPYMIPGTFIRRDPPENLLRSAFYALWDISYDLKQDLLTISEDKNVLQMKITALEKESLSPKPTRRDVSGVEIHDALRNLRIKTIELESLRRQFNDLQQKTAKTEESRASARREIEYALRPRLQERNPVDVGLILDRHRQEQEAKYENTIADGRVRQMELQKQVRDLAAAHRIEQLQVKELQTKYDDLFDQDSKLQQRLAEIENERLIQHETTRDIIVHDLESLQVKYNALDIEYSKVRVQRDNAISICATSTAYMRNMIREQNISQVYMQRDFEITRLARRFGSIPQSPPGQTAEQTGPVCDGNGSDDTIEHLRRNRYGNRDFGIVPFRAGSLKTMSLSGFKPLRSSQMVSGSPSGTSRLRKMRPLSIKVGGKARRLPQAYQSPKPQGYYPAPGLRLGTAPLASIESSDSSGRLIANILTPEDTLKGLVPGSADLFAWKDSMRKYSGQFGPHGLTPIFESFNGWPISFDDTATVLYDTSSVDFERRIHTFLKDEKVIVFTHPVSGYWAVKTIDNLSDRIFVLPESALALTCPHGHIYNEPYQVQHLWTPFDGPEFLDLKNYRAVVYAAHSENSEGTADKLGTLYRCVKTANGAEKGYVPADCLTRSPINHPCNFQVKQCPCIEPRPYTGRAMLLKDCISDSREVHFQEHDEVDIAHALSSGLFCIRKRSNGETGFVHHVYLRLHRQPLDIIDHHGEFEPYVADFTPRYFGMHEADLIPGEEKSFEQAVVEQPRKTHYGLEAVQFSEGAIKAWEDNTHGDNPDGKTWAHFLETVHKSHIFENWKVGPPENDVYVEYRDFQKLPQPWKDVLAVNPLGPRRGWRRARSKSLVLREKIKNSYFKRGAYVGFQPDRTIADGEVVVRVPHTMIVDGKMVFQSNDDAELDRGYLSDPVTQEKRSRKRHYIFAQGQQPVRTDAYIDPDSISVGEPWKSTTAKFWYQQGSRIRHGFLDDTGLQVLRNILLRKVGREDVDAHRGDFADGRYAIEEAAVTEILNHLSLANAVVYELEPRSPPLYQHIPGSGNNYFDIVDIRPGDEANPPRVVGRRITASGQFSAESDKLYEIKATDLAYRHPKIRTAIPLTSENNRESYAQVWLMGKELEGNVVAWTGFINGQWRAIRDETIELEHAQSWIPLQEAISAIEVAKTIAHDQSSTDSSSDEFVHEVAINWDVFFSVKNDAVDNGQSCQFIRPHLWDGELVQGDLFNSGSEIAQIARVQECDVDWYDMRFPVHRYKPDVVGGDEREEVVILKRKGEFVYCALSNADCALFLLENLMITPGAPEFRSLNDLVAQGILGENILGSLRRHGDRAITETPVALEKKGSVAGENIPDLKRSFAATSRSRTPTELADPVMEDITGDEQHTIPPDALNRNDETGSHFSYVQVVHRSVSPFSDLGADPDTQPARSDGRTVSRAKAPIESSVDDQDQERLPPLSSSTGSSAPLAASGADSIVNLFPHGANTTTSPAAEGRATTGHQTSYDYRRIMPRYWQHSTYVRRFPTRVRRRQPSIIRKWVRQSPFSTIIGRTKFLSRNSKQKLKGTNATSMIATTGAEAERYIDLLLSEANIDFDDDRAILQLNPKIAINDSQSPHVRSQFVHTWNVFNTDVGDVYGMPWHEPTQMPRRKFPPFLSPGLFSTPCIEDVGSPVADLVHPNITVAEIPYSPIFKLSHELLGIGITFESPSLASSHGSDQSVSTAMTTPSSSMIDGARHHMAMRSPSLLESALPNVYDSDNSIFPTEQTSSSTKNPTSMTTSPLLPIPGQASRHLQNSWSRSPLSLGSMFPHGDIADLSVRAESESVYTHDLAMIKQRSRSDCSGTWSLESIHPVLNLETSFERSEAADSSTPVDRRRRKSEADLIKPEVDMNGDMPVAPPKALHKVIFLPWSASPSCSASAAPSVPPLHHLLIELLILLWSRLACLVDSQNPNTPQTRAFSFSCPSSSRRLLRFKSRPSPSIYLRAVKIAYWGCLTWLLFATYLVRQEWLDVNGLGRDRGTSLVHARRRMGGDGSGGWDWDWEWGLGKCIRGCL